MLRSLTRLRLTGVVVRQRGTPVAVVIVEEEILASRRPAERILRAARPFFPGLDVVLATRETWARRTWGPASEFTVVVEESARPKGAPARRTLVLRRGRGRRRDVVGV